MLRNHSYLVILLSAGALQAKVDLVTLPARDSVQLTIYNAADLTLARERRSVVLAPGTNRLQFSWENTLIDPTSLDLRARARAASVDIAELSFPPRVRNLGLWSIRSEVSGAVPVEIAYLTSGLSWQAFYLATLCPDESHLRLQGYVRVSNQSGEDYEKAQVRLVVGQVQVLDAIAGLARREQPYGRPGPPEPEAPAAHPRASLQRGREVRLMMAQAVDELALAPKEVRKEGLSEYFLYSIEGTETIPHGWSKRLASFAADAIPVTNRYKYDEQSYRGRVVRFLSFKNDADHRLGVTPIPNGHVRVFGRSDDGHLGYVGASQIPYIPVGQEVELDLGPAPEVLVEARLLDFQQEQLRFDRDGNLAGWDEVRRFELKCRNTRDRPVEIEITRHTATAAWKVTDVDPEQGFTQLDAQRIRFLVTLAPHAERPLAYTLRTYHGTRETAGR